MKHKITLFLVIFSFIYFILGFCYIILFHDELNYNLEAAIGGVGMILIIMILVRIRKEEK